MHVDVLDAHVAEVGDHGRQVAELEENLNERPMLRRSLGAKPAHEHFERDGLMGVGVRQAARTRLSNSMNVIFGVDRDPHRENVHE